MEAAILDNGNFVLRSITNQDKMIWQSFDFPADTWLPEMNITLGSKLISWKGINTLTVGLLPLHFREKEKHTRKKILLLLDWHQCGSKSARVCEMSLLPLLSFYSPCPSSLLTLAEFVFAAKAKGFTRPF
jgi:hypothetical protein